MCTNAIKALCCPKFERSKEDLKKEAAWNGKADRESFKELKGVLSCVRHKISVNDEISMTSKITHLGSLLNIVEKGN